MHQRDVRRLLFLFLEHRDAIGLQVSFSIWRDLVIDAQRLQVHGDQQHLHARHSTVIEFSLLAMSGQQQEARLLVLLHSWRDTALGEQFRHAAVALGHSHERALTKALMCWTQGDVHAMLNAVLRTWCGTVISESELDARAVLVSSKHQA